MIDDGSGSDAIVELGRCAVIVDNPASAWLPAYGPEPPPGPIERSGSVILPLVFGSEVLGTMSVLRDLTPSAFTTDEVDCAGDLADLAAVSLHLARLRTS